MIHDVIAFLRRLSGCAGMHALASPEPSSCPSPSPSPSFHLPSYWLPVHLYPFNCHIKAPVSISTLFIRASASDRQRLAFGCGVTAAFPLSIAFRDRCLLQLYKGHSLSSRPELIPSHRARPFAFDEIVYLYNLALLLSPSTPECCASCATER